MQNLISVIEQEMKFISDSEEGSRQYRKGYLRALRIVTEFLDLQKPDAGHVRTPTCSAVARLLSMLSLELGAVHAQPAAVSIEEKETLDYPAINPWEKNALQIALGVLRSGTDYGDFLCSWLHDYGARVLSSNPPDPLPPEVSTEEELALRIQDAPFYIH